MIDIKLIREDPDAYRQAAKVKGLKVDIDELLGVDKQLLDAQRELQDVRTAQNAAGKEIAKLKGDAKKQAIEKMSSLKARVRQLGEALENLEPKFEATKFFFYLGLWIKREPNPE